jgi:hypothetical protein
MSLTKLKTEKNLSFVKVKRQRKVLLVESFMEAASLINWGKIIILEKLFHAKILPAINSFPPKYGQK